MSDSLDMGYYRLALYDAKRRNLSKTIIHARKALLLNAENESARRLLGICLYEMGDLDGAAKALDGCTELIGTVLAERSHMNEALDAARGLASRKKWRKAGSLLCSLGH
ncbi:MAG: hypothetical protein LBH28_10830, partial [Oscillospiraceae bacterium]|nr:hypothetical protein [Oscillospiraceae bacterium]